VQTPAGDRKQGRRPGGRGSYQATVIRSHSWPPCSSRSAIRDRVILGADLAVAVVVDEKAITAEPVVTGSLAGMNEGRGANEGPVQVLDAAVVVEGRGLGERFRLPLLRKAGGVH
jgi:hypothetical protein